MARQIARNARRLSRVSGNSPSSRGFNPSRSLSFQLPGAASLEPLRVVGRRAADEALEVADEVGLVGISKVESQAGPVHDGSLGHALRRVQQAEALDDPLRADADMLVEQPREIAGAGGGHLRQGLDRPVAGRRGGDGVLGPVNGRVNMVAPLQPGRELRIGAGPPEIDDEIARDGQRRRVAGLPLNAIFALDDLLAERIDIPALAQRLREQPLGTG